MGRDAHDQIALYGLFARRKEEGWGMANEEHLTRLKEGVEARSAWRKNNREVIPHLTKADLFGACLAGANLEGRISPRQTSPGHASAGRTSTGRISLGRLLSG